MKLNSSTRIKAMNPRSTTKSVAADAVLEKMAATIQSDNPGHASKGTYTDIACYGAVAHKLKAHLNPAWFILMYSSGEDIRSIAHVCLYDNSGHPIVDTMDGKPTLFDGHLYYEMPGSDIESYPLACCITVANFSKLYLS